MVINRSVVCLFLVSIGFSAALSHSWKFLEYLHREPPAPVAKSSLRVVAEGWVEQQVDHYDDNNNETYQMRYLGNDEFYKPGGPIFIYVGGEWTISPKWVLGGHMYDMAKELNGYLFYTEHRYYGQSHPTPDLSFANLQYLHVKQALEDLAHFIRTKKQEIHGAENSGVILVGASYAGTMVTWFRQMYPELINGAWSSSAPLLAKTEFVEYLEVVGESIRTVGGDECYNTIHEDITELESMIEANDFAGVSEKMNLCTTLPNNKLDIWIFFNSLSQILAWVVQYHEPGEIESHCKVITSRGWAEYVKQSFGECWTPNYEEFVEQFSQTSWESEAAFGTRQWFFQTCNEFGWYQTSGSPNQPFGSSFPIEFFYQRCTDIYDESFYKESINYNVYITNLAHNGMNPIITNVYSTHGELDPWRPMGVQEDVNSFAPAFVIPGASHCADLYSISDEDSSEMLASKHRTTTLVRRWLWCNNTRRNGAPLI